MTAKKKTTTKGDKKGKVEGSKAQAVKLDVAMDERVRAIITDPGVKRSVKNGLDRLVSKLAEYVDASVMPDLPETDVAQYMAVANAYLCEQEEGTLTDEAREAAAKLVEYVERHEPEEYKVARRCAEVWEAQRAKDEAEGGDGTYFFMTAIDRVTEGGGDGLMIGSPREELFTLVFTRAVRDIGYDDEDYVALKELIARVEAGASLAAMHEEDERRHAERSAERLREILNSPEPKDKTSDEWRYWKLRRVEADFASDDLGRNRAAWRYFEGLLRGLVADENFWHVSNVHRLLADLIIARQEIDKLDGQERRSQAGMKAAETRKRKAAKKSV